MELDVGEIIFSINKIRDNLWIKDFDEVKNIASSISFVDEKTESLGYTEDKQYQIREFRKIAKQQDDKNPKAWMSKHASDYFIEHKISMFDYIVDTMLLRLKEYSQDYEIEGKDNEVLIKTEKYKALVIDRHPTYEIRALPISKFKIPNEQDVKKISLDLDLLLPDVEKNEFSATMRFFSNKEFVESTILPYSAWFKIILKTADLTRAEDISASILSTLTI